MSTDILTFRGVVEHSYVESLIEAGDWEQFALYGERRLQAQYDALMLELSEAEQLDEIVKGAAKLKKAFDSARKLWKQKIVPKIRELSTGWRSDAMGRFRASRISSPAAAAKKVDQTRDRIEKTLRKKGIDTNSFMFKAGQKFSAVILGVLKPIAETMAKWVLEAGVKVLKAGGSLAAGTFAPKTLAGEEGVTDIDRPFFLKWAGRAILVMLIGSVWHVVVGQAAFGGILALMGGALWVLLAKIEPAFAEFRAKFSPSPAAARIARKKKAAEKAAKLKAKKAKAGATQ